MLRNNIDFMKTRQYSLSEIFSSGLYNEIKEFTILKTFFKEVKVIRPLCISKTKQIEISPEYALLQVKIENITSSINFFDKSLKLSKFLDTSSCDELLNNGMSLVIKDIQIIKEETSIENKSIINSKNQEMVINTEGVPIGNIHFALQNEDFPLEIKPGEEVFIIIKVFKSSFMYEQIIKAKDNTKQEVNKLYMPLPVRKDSDSSKHTETLSRISKLKGSDNNISIINSQNNNNSQLNIIAPTKSITNESNFK
jgi:hypothetical protein